MTAILIAVLLQLTFLVKREHFKLYALNQCTNSFCFRNLCTRNLEFTCRNVKNYENKQYVCFVSESGSL